MFKIGDFSKICQVSIKALRHWDDVGLLKPAHTDRFTGYRYYEIGQLREVNRILAFRGLGLSLNQINRLLAEDLPVEEIRGMLRLKKAEIQQQLEVGQVMLNLVEARLHQIEREGRLPEYDTVIRSVEAQRVVTIREVTSTMQDLIDLLVEAEAVRQKHPDEAAGVLLAVFYDDGFEYEEIDVAVGFPVKPDFAGCIPARGGEMTCDDLPGFEMMACTVHKGGWDSLAQGYADLGHWIDANGYTIIGPGREIYHDIGEPPDHRSTITELQFPVTK